jgi:hypothetical protein
MLGFINQTPQPPVRTHTRDHPAPCPQPPPAPKGAADAELDRHFSTGTSSTVRANSPPAAAMPAPAPPPPRKRPALLCICIAGFFLLAGLLWWWLQHDELTVVPCTTSLLTFGAPVIYMTDINCFPDGRTCSVSEVTTCQETLNTVLEDAEATLPDITTYLNFQLPVQGFTWKLNRDESIFPPGFQTTYPFAARLEFYACTFAQDACQALEIFFPACCKQLRTISDLSNVTASDCTADLGSICTFPNPNQTSLQATTPNVTCQSGVCVQH